MAHRGWITPLQLTYISDLPPLLSLYARPQRSSGTVVYGVPILTLGNSRRVGANDVTERGEARFVFYVEQCLPVHAAEGGHRPCHVT